MFEYTCPVCGKVTQVEKEHQVRTFCSRECASAAREFEKRMIRENCIEGECVFQPESIICFKRDCINCGWNPVVAKARLEAIMENPILAFKSNVEIKSFCADWIAVEESLPEDKVQVLAYTHTGKVMSLHRKGGSWCAPINVVVTHWMPMPDAPLV